MNIAIIPARGGSKRIPRKNIRPFLGVPLLTRTVNILKETSIFDRIIVSTDDDEIASVACSAGAEVPFRRPFELADDYAGTHPVIAHAVRSIEESGVNYEFVCCIYPTAVLSLPVDYRQALTLLSQSEADYVFTATSFSYPIQRALRLNSDGRCEMFWKEYQQSRSQDLEPAFHDAGQFYLGRREAWLNNCPIFSSMSRMLILPSHRVQDIDTHEDWERAEQIYLLTTGKM